jgi:hypothetical protein
VTWSEALRYATQTAGIQVILGFCLSILSDYWPAFQRQSKQVKQAVFAGICLAIPLVGCTLGVLTAGWPPSWDVTFWPALVAGFAAFTTGTLFHAAKTSRSH